MILDIVLPALMIGLLICALHVPLGLEVLKRGVIFIDLAIAQIAGLGVVIAKLYFIKEMEPDPNHDYSLIVQISAFVFALAAAGFFRYTEKIVPHLQEAIIGSVYIIASSLALLLLANHPHGGEEIQAMLAGQILWVDWQEIFIAAGIFSVILFLWHGSKFRNIRTHYFYFIFAAVVTLSVQLVGVYLVFASLIFPALGAAAHQNKPKVAYGIAFLAFCLGIGVSVIMDLPTGLIVVCTLAIFTGLSALIHIYQLWCARQESNL